MPRLSRRGFLALGGTGTAAVALGACGSSEDPRDEGNDGQLLINAAAAESTYGASAKGFADQQGVSAEIEKASATRVEELTPAVKAAGAAAHEPRIDRDPADVEEAALIAIVAYREGARLLSTPELRTKATQFLGQIAGELAALRDLAREEPAPYAFVTGLDEEPLQSFDDIPTAERETTTSTTSTAAEGK